MKSFPKSFRTSSFLALAVAAALAGWLANPVRWSAANSQSPERSPVKTRPVRLPPFAAGASPTIRALAWGSPNDGTGRPQYGSCLNEARRFVVATDSRQSTSRGQARHTETAASSPVRSVAATASRVTSSAVWATGVAAVAGSPGQPLPGGTGDAKASPVSGCGSVGTTPG